MTPEEKAKSDFDTICKQLATNKPNDNQSEQAYGKAYQRMVDLGMAQPIKRKYKGR